MRKIKKKASLIKGDATMLQRLSYFQGGNLLLSDKLDLLVRSLESDDPLPVEQKKIAACFLRSLLQNKRFVRALDDRRGRPTARRGEDIALYFYACKKLYGEGGYAAALAATTTAWKLKEQTIQRYAKDFEELTPKRFEDIREQDPYTKNLSEESFLKELLADIADDHMTDAAAEWRVEFLRAKQLELGYETSPIGKANQDWILLELQRIQRHSRK